MAPQLEPPRPISHWPVGRLEVEGAEGMVGMGLLWLVFIHQGRAGLLGCWAGVYRRPEMLLKSLRVRHVCLERGGEGAETIQTCPSTLVDTSPRGVLELRDSSTRGQPLLRNPGKRTRK